MTSVMSRAERRAALLSAVEVAEQAFDDARDRVRDATDRKNRADTDEREARRNLAKARDALAETLPKVAS
jgi:predicted  nucleic acid-binding Zn-ribbon protein